MRAESRRSSNKKRELRFIITDPSSNQDRVESIREIRSHAGHWRWDKERESRHKQGAGDSESITADTSAVSTTYGGRFIVFDGEEEEEIKRSDGLFTSSEPSIESSHVATPAAGLNSQPSPETGLVVTGNTVTLASCAALVESSHMAGNRSASYQDPPGIAKSIGVDNLDPFQTFLPSSLPQHVVSTALKYCMINSLPHYV
ncbi:hypothetical protein EIK77_005497 [Talaromyces pinophilus]|nr:hypothetical protein EIK77_005497 [Talaromyces pinophilus]PCG98061.1 hypothetical protein PENOC_065150 [Penicillium occitanis (nom. inval.)]PCH05761.1 Hypothetical protein PENO1_020780 [Penicillium occitanis (nom. inval.)]